MPIIQPAGGTPRWNTPLGGAYSINCTEDGAWHDVDLMTGGDVRTNCVATIWSIQNSGGVASTVYMRAEGDTQTPTPLSLAAGAFHAYICGINRTNGKVQYNASASTIVCQLLMEVDFS